MRRIYDAFGPKIRTKELPVKLRPPDTPAMSKDLEKLTVAECLAALLCVPSLVAEIAELRKQVAVLAAPKMVEKPVQWVRLKDAAERLNVSVETARRFVSRGLLRRNKACRHILILASDLEKFSSKVVG